jgi:hypothetical protein
MSEEASSRRVDIATWVGTVLWIIMIESHVMSRPLVFLFGPFVALFCFLAIASPIPAKRRWRMSLLAAVVSVVGFLFTRYVFR